MRFSRENQWRTVVGVINDVRAYDLQHNTPDFMKGTIYVPYGPKATLEGGRVPSDMTVVVQTGADEGQFSAILHRTVAALSAEVPVTEVKTMRTVISEAVQPPHLRRFCLAPLQEWHSFWVSWAFMAFFHFWSREGGRKSGFAWLLALAGATFCCWS